MNRSLRSKKRARRKSKNHTSGEVTAPARQSKRQRRSANKALASTGNAQTSTATPASDEVASQPDSAKSQASNTGSKKRPQNGTPEELMAFKQSKSERMKAKRAARNKEQGGAGETKLFCYHDLFPLAVRAFVGPALFITQADPRSYALPLGSSPLAAEV